MNFLISFLIAYLFGSIPFGLLIGKWTKKIDIREQGSRNIGTTNVFRVVGKQWGIVVFLLDAAKGYFGVLTACLFSDQALGSSISFLYAVAAILGHTFPVWLSFKGGKGVATSLGVFLAVAFIPTIAAFGLWIAVFSITRIVSLSSLCAAVLFPIASLLYVQSGTGNGVLIPLSLLLCSFMFYTHRENIKRLLAKEEKPLF